MEQVVLLSGEAGIGKSRMVQVLKKHVTGNPRAWLTECHCSPYHQNSALYSAINLLERAVLQFNRGDSPQRRLSKLEGFLMQQDFSLEEGVPLFAFLLSIPHSDDRYPPHNLTPQRQKQKILQAVLTMLLKRATQQPVLLVVEDLHWADASTLELLSPLFTRYQQLVSSPCSAFDWILRTMVYPFAHDTDYVESLNP